MNKVYDCFQFFNELDILEIRLNELNSQVDYFVIVEAELSHQMKSKPLYFYENKNRYEKFLDKIIHVVVGKNEFNTDTWYNENLQRRMLLKGIETANDNDFIMISDCDEIISNSALEYIKNNFHEDAYIFEQNLYFWYLNTRANNFKWTNAGIARKKTIDKIGTQSFKDGVKCLGYPRVNNGGWHFSYLGDSSRVKQKIENFAHTEFSYITTDDLKQHREKLIDPLGRTNEGIDLVVDPINTMPVYVQNNLEKFKDMLRN